MNHRVGSYLFGAVAGLLAAWAAYEWITDPQRLEERRQQEQAVLLAREHLIATLGIGTPEIVDPLIPERRVGKAYVYAQASGWEVSGFYRRDDDDDWHAYLVALDADGNPTLVRIEDDDAALAAAARSDPILEVLP